VKLNVPVKKCKELRGGLRRGVPCIGGYPVLAHVADLDRGIVYWAIRGGVERCPSCKSKDFDVTYGEIEV